MGIGHPGNKNAVASFVLRDFAKADEGWLDDVLRGCSDGAVDLAEGDSGKFMNAIGRRVNPPRSSTSIKKGDATPTPKAAKNETAPNPSPQPSLSPLQKLMDKFS
jgi:PTH1 family peptidyl-tRNA hydrolase